MALELQVIREKIASAQNLQSVVETMRGLAAVNIRRAEAAARQGLQYARVVHLGLYVVLRDLGNGVPATSFSRDDGLNLPLTAIVITSDQGLCGQFNERIVEYAYDFFAELERRSKQRGIAGYDRDRQLIVVGARGFERFDMAGEKIVAFVDAPNSVESIPRTLSQTLASLEALIASNKLGRLFVIYNRADGASFSGHHLQLVPFQPARWTRLPAGEPDWSTIPATSMPPQHILEYLIRQQIYIDLFQALTHSFAAENGARLASMQSASENIKERLGELEAIYRRVRQEVITNELMDLMGGVSAVSS